MKTYRRDVLDPQRKTTLDRLDRDRRQAAEHARQREAEQNDLERRRLNAKLSALMDDYRELPPAATENTAGLTFWTKVHDQFLYPMLGLAQSKARHAYLQGMRQFTTIFHMGVGRADIALTGRKCQITLSADDSFAFEFATTGAPVSIYEAGQVQEGAGLYAIDFVTVVANVKADGGVLTRTVRINTGKRENALPGPTSLINAGRQIQGLHEPRVHPSPTNLWGRLSTPYILMHSYDPMSSHVGPYHRSTTCRPRFLTPSNNSESGGVFNARDIDYDLPFTISQNAGYSKDAVFPAPGSDWPRVAGLQKVTHPVHGVRVFGISIDAQSNFVIFPVDAIVQQSDPLAQSVSETYVTRVDPTYPEWVWRNATKSRDLYQENPSIDALIVDTPQYAWKFNYNGTKACAVMHERREYLNDTAFWADRADANTPWTQDKFDTLCSWMGIESLSSIQTPSSHGGTDRYMVAPGLVEATIGIEITGPELHSYTASVVVEEVRKPEDCTAPIVHAGYSWIPGLKCNELDVPVTSLITITLEAHMRTGVVTAQDERVALWVVKDETEDVEIFSILSDARVVARTTYGAFVSLLAWDPQTFSFVWRFDADHIPGVTYPKSSYSLAAPAEQWITERGVWPVILGEPRDMIFPETMPEDVRQVMRTIPHLDGRAQLKKVENPEMTFIEMNLIFDEWNGAAVNNYRDYWAFDWHDGEKSWYVYPVDPDYGYYGGGVYGQVRYKQDSENPEPTLTSAGEEVAEFLRLCGAEHEFLMFCTAPKFGWHLYAAYLAQHVQFHNWDTFYTHPNGTWAYYNDRMLYDRNGLPRQFDGDYSWSATSTPNALSVYDAERVEHWIVDVVHFETRINNVKQGGIDTSFFELYNAAIDAGADPSLEKMKEEDDAGLGRRAKFFLNTTATWDESRPSDRMLALRCEWHGKTGWLYEPLITNGTPAISMFGYGELYRPALSGVWFRNATPNTSIQIYEFGMHGQSALEAPAWWHMRFYDPTVIMSR